MLNRQAPGRVFASSSWNKSTELGFQGSCHLWYIRQAGSGEVSIPSTGRTPPQALVRVPVALTLGIFSLQIASLLLPSDSVPYKAFFSSFVKQWGPCRSRRLCPYEQWSEEGKRLLVGSPAPTPTVITLLTQVVML